MRILAFLSGASRGFGRSLAVQLARAATARGVDMTWVLFARDAAGLDGTRDAIRTVAPESIVITAPLDMRDLDAIQPAWDAALASVSAAVPSPPDRWLLVNNSGSLGDTCPVAAVPSLASLRATIDSNITAVMWMTALFLKLVASAKGTRSVPSVKSTATAHATVINISSLAAIQPFPSQAEYSTGKAARDMFHAVVAVEEAGVVNTLNYAPGPLDTDMQKELRDSPLLHGPMRDMFRKMKEEGTLIAPDASAAVCAGLYFDAAYRSGDHVDYFDLVTPTSPTAGAGTTHADAGAAR